jgi:hypothetical protein
MFAIVLYIIFVLTYSNGEVTCGSQSVKPKAAVSKPSVARQTPRFNAL